MKWRIFRYALPTVTITVCKPELQHFSFCGTFIIPHAQNRYTINNVGSWEKHLRLIYVIFIEMYHHNIFLAKSALMFCIYEEQYLTFNYEIIPCDINCQDPTFKVTWFSHILLINMECRSSKNNTTILMQSFWY